MEEFNQYQFPESYRENSHKEKLALAHAENFRRQYVHLYRDRKPLFLNPVNESNVEVRIYSLDYYSIQLFLHIPLIYVSFSFRNLFARALDLLSCHIKSYMIGMELRSSLQII